MAVKKSREKANEKERTAGKVGYLYLLLMLGVFPLFYRNNYINIMESKWLFFMVTTLAAAAGAVVIAALERLAKAGRVRPELTVAEWFLVFFMAVVMISWLGTLRSGYFKEAWDGSLGKLAGVFMYLMLFVAYFLVSRCGTFDKYIRNVFLWAGFLVFSLAVLNHFMVDPLHMYENLDPEQYWMFCSTMGNINVLSGYFSIYVPFTVALFLYESSMDGVLLYGLMMCCSFMGVIAANSDAGIIGVGAGFVFLLWFAMEEPFRLRRYAVAAALFFTSAAIIGNMDESFADTVKEPLETLPSFVSKPPVSIAGMAATWCLVVLLTIMLRKRTPVSARTYVPQLIKIRKVLFIALGVILIGCLAIFFYFSVMDTNTPLGSWDTYLRFSDLWGSSRGFTWKRTLAIFSERYGIFEKLFGVGPDLMIVPYHTWYHDQIMEKMGAYLADAHSEFMQTLGTTGILGVVGYFGFQIASLSEGLKQKEKDGLTVALSVAGLSYTTQALFCSQQTFSTPLFFIMLALGAEKRHGDKKNG